MPVVVSDLLPPFPWDTLAAVKKIAAAHPDGLCDLSVGTPVDPVPQLAVDALAASASRWAGYPTTIGTPALRDAIVRYMGRRWGVQGLTDAGVLPVPGTKELVALLPTLLGLGEGDVVVFPTAAYPTYEVGARLAGATPIACDDPAQLASLNPSLIWINSPANPHGAILDAEQTRAWVDAARTLGAVLASDECYGEFGWDAEPVSVLDPRVCGGDHAGLLAVHSLSKRSNVAGFRAGWVAGDPAIVGELTAVRKHAGLMMPGPIQEAMIPLLADQAHVDAQRERYARRRAILKPALEAAGFRIDHSEGSLYLWATKGEDGRSTVTELAQLGILVAPGDFYGEAGRQHVRIALTASDERVGEAARRLRATAAS